MSHKNGNRSRHDRQKKANLHNRTKIRAMRKAATTATPATAAKQA